LELQRLDLLKPVQLRVGTSKAGPAKADLQRLGPSQAWTFKGWAFKG
jgi:hypothetical protein